MRIACLMVCLMAGPVFAAGERAPHEAFRLDKGVDCGKSKTAAHEGETHRCIFEPAVFGKRDFGTRNSRAEYVFSRLGTDCDAMEILADEALDGSPDPAVPLRRVSILCED